MTKRIMLLLLAAPVMSITGRPADYKESESSGHIKCLLSNGIQIHVLTHKHPDGAYGEELYLEDQLIYQNEMYGKVLRRPEIIVNKKVMKEAFMKITL